jgi:hypothetical protein
MNLMRVYLLVMFTVLSFTLTGCASRRANLKKESYSVNRGKAPSNLANPEVYGCLFEYGTKYPATVPAIKLGKQVISRADPGSGRYSFHIKPGKYRFVGIAIGFYQTKTRRIKVSKGDSLQINFYLKVDERPIIN